MNFNFTEYEKTAFECTMERIQKEFAKANNNEQSFGEALRAATAILHGESQRLEIIKATSEIKAIEDDKLRSRSAYWFAHRLLVGDDKLDKNTSLGLIWLKNAADWGDERAKLEIGEF